MEQLAKVYNFEVKLLIITNFFNNYCNSSEILLKEYQNNPIDINGNYMCEWYQRKQRNIVNSEDLINDVDGRSYLLNIKGLSKSTIYEPFKEVKGQSIHEHKKVLTEYMSSIMREVFQCHEIILKENYALDLYLTDGMQDAWFRSIKADNFVEVRHLCI